MIENLCPVCAAAIKGRSDKKFCSQKCKSIQQYERRQSQEFFYLMVDKQLKTNRRLLKRYNQSGMATIRKEELMAQGFNPFYHTHYWHNQKGDCYYFVYEFGFLERAMNGKSKYVLVTWQPYMDKNPKG